MGRVVNDGRVQTINCGRKQPHYARVNFKKVSGESHLLNYGNDSNTLVLYPDLAFILSMHNFRLFGL